VNNCFANKQNAQINYVTGASIAVSLNVLEIQQVIANQQYYARVIPFHRPTVIRPVPVLFTAVRTGATVNWYISIGLCKAVAAYLNRPSLLLAHLNLSEELAHY